MYKLLTNNQNGSYDMHRRQLGSVIINKKQDVCAHDAMSVGVMLILSSGVLLDPIHLLMADVCLHSIRVIESRIVSFFFQAEDGIRDDLMTGVQTCAFFFSSRRRHTR